MVQFMWEYLIVRRTGEQMGPYRLRVNAERDYEQWRGASLYRRWVIRSKQFRLVDSKAWDET